MAGIRTGHKNKKGKSTKLRILIYINEWRSELIISQLPEVLSHFKDSNMVPAPLLWFAEIVFFFKCKGTEWAGRENKGQ